MSTSVAAPGRDWGALAVGSNVAVPVPSVGPVSGCGPEGRSRAARTGVVFGRTTLIQVPDVDPGRISQGEPLDLRFGRSNDGKEFNGLQCAVRLVEIDAAAGVLAKGFARRGQIAFIGLSGHLRFDIGKVRVLGKIDDQDHICRKTSILQTPDGDVSHVVDTDHRLHVGKEAPRVRTGKISLPIRSSGQQRERLVIAFGRADEDHLDARDLASSRAVDEPSAQGGRRAKTRIFTRPGRREALRFDLQPEIGFNVFAPEDFGCQDFAVRCDDLDEDVTDNAIEFGQLEKGLVGSVNRRHASCRYDAGRSCLAGRLFVQTECGLDGMSGERCIATLDQEYREPRHEIHPPPARFPALDVHTGKPRTSRSGMLRAAPAPNFFDSMSPFNERDHTTSTGVSATR